LSVTVNVVALDCNDVEEKRVSKENPVYYKFDTDTRPAVVKAINLLDKHVDVVV
jgi:hypothetical protein